MKNRNLLVLFILVLLATLFFGCSKESPVIGSQTTPPAIQSNNDGTGNGGRVAPRHYGSIIGVLVPVPVKARIVAFNDQCISEEIACKQDGSFELNNLAPGSYIIRIDYVPVGASDYYSIMVPKVVVIAGDVTNLGNINL